MWLHSFIWLSTLHSYLTVFSKKYDTLHVFANTGALEHMGTWGHVPTIFWDKALKMSYFWILSSPSLRQHFFCPQYLQIRFGATVTDVWLLFSECYLLFLISFFSSEFKCSALFMVKWFSLYLNTSSIMTKFHPTDWK